MKNTEFKKSGAKAKAFSRQDAREQSRQERQTQDYLKGERASQNLEPRITRIKGKAKPGLFKRQVNLSAEAHAMSEVRKAFSRQDAREQSRPESKRRILIKD